MSKNTVSKTNATFYLPNETLHRLDGFAQSRKPKVKKSTLVEIAIDEYLDREEVVNAKKTIKKLDDHHKKTGISKERIAEFALVEYLSK